MVSHWSSQGGAERCLYDAAKCLRSAGIEVVCLFPHRGSMTRKLEALGIEVHTVSYRWWIGKDIDIVKRVARNIWNLLCLPRICWTIFRSRADVVYTNTSTIWIGAAAARLLNLPHIWHLHEYAWETFAFKWDLGKALSLWWIGAGSDVVLLNSRTTAAKYEAYGAKWSGRVLYQGFDIEKHGTGTGVMQQRSPALRLGAVGFVNEQKRQIDAIKSLSILSGNGFDLELNLIGHVESSFQRFLTTKAKEWGVDDRVRFLGFVDSASDIYSQFDVLVVPSLEESFGRVTVEAMLANVVVVAADSGANAELIRDRETGFLFRGGDADHLAQVLEQVITDDVLRRTVSDRAYTEARERFAMPVMQLQLARLVHELAQSRPQRGRNTLR